MKSVYQGLNFLRKKCLHIIICAILIAFISGYCHEARPRIIKENTINAVIFQTKGHHSVKPRIKGKMSGGYASDEDMDSEDERHNKRYRHSMVA